MWDVRRQRRLESRGDVVMTPRQFWGVYLLGVGLGISLSVLIFTIARQVG